MKTQHPKSNHEAITPNVAMKYMERNTINRPINDGHLDYLVSEMKKGNWHNTGESIKFSKNGELLDGQHRLMAIIKSGISQEMFVVRELENETFKFMDTHKPRTASDVLGIERVKYPGRVAPTVKFILNFKRGGHSASATRVNRGSTKISNSMVSEFYHKHKTKINNSLVYGYHKHNKFISHSALSGLHYIFNEIDIDKADVFCHGICEGVGLTKDSPIHLLRNRLIQDMKGTRKMRPFMKVALVCKAWNHFRNNKKVNNIVWNSETEPFPKPI